MASSVIRPMKKVLFAPENTETKVLFTRFCKKGQECKRGAECAFAHTYEALNPVLCAHERGKQGCTKRTGCLFMHLNESKYKYVMRACQDDLARCGIELPAEAAVDSPVPPPPKIGISTKTSEQAAATMRSAYTELCEKTKHFKESWADIDEDECKYELSKEQLQQDPDFTTMKDYNQRTMYRLWGDGTFQVNRGDGEFVTCERNGQVLHNAYEILGSVSPTAEEDDESANTNHTAEKKSARLRRGTKSSKKHVK